MRLFFGKEMKDISRLIENEVSVYLLEYLDLTREDRVHRVI